MLKTFSQAAHRYRCTHSVANQPTPLRYTLFRRYRL